MANKVKQKSKTPNLALQAIFETAWHINLENGGNQYRESPNPSKSWFKIRLELFLQVFLHTNHLSMNRLSEATSKKLAGLKWSLLLLSIFFVRELPAQSMSWTTDCSEKNFCLNQNSCTQGQVFLVEKATTSCGSTIVNYSYKIDLNNDNTVDIQSSNDTISGVFAKGTHKVTWRATDNCSNVIQCTYLFHVKDCQPPSLLCINGLTQSLDAPECLRKFTATQFILSMSDNCTPNNQLVFGIRKSGDGTGFPGTDTISFGSCDAGFNSIEVWIKDGNGLANQCNNYVLMQNNGSGCICDNDADVYLNGCVRTGAGTRVNTFKAKTRLETLPGSANPLVKNYSQNIEDSCYAIHLDHIPFANSYLATIRGERTLGALVGVTTFDLVLISKHILGIEPFTSLYQMVAADVNKSKSVTTFDIVETRKLILGIYDTFPSVPAWRFSRPVADPSQVAAFNTLVDTYQVVLNNLNADRTLQNFPFVGIKYGDVNGSALFNALDDRYDGDPLLLGSEDRKLNAGEEAIIDLRFSKAARLEGWQMELAADPDLLQIESVEGLPSDQYHLNGNSLSALWADGAGRDYAAGEAMFSLKVKALHNTSLSEALSLTSERMKAEAYQANAANTRSRLLWYFGSPEQDALFYAPRPNPFADETDFNLFTKAYAPAYLEVFDQNGRLVFSNQYDLEPGMQSIRLQASALPGKGVFGYRIRVGNSVVSGRLIRL